MGASRTFKNWGATRTPDWPYCTGRPRTGRPLQQNYFSALFKETLSLALSLLSLNYMLIWHFSLFNV